MRRLLILVVVVLLVVACGCGYLWWTRPWRTSVPVPPELEDADSANLHGSVLAPGTETGRLVAGPLYSRNHEWVGTVQWEDRYTGERRAYELRLGESAHIEGFGTVTLIGVNPPPLIPVSEAGGRGYDVRIVYDPGVVPYDPRVDPSEGGSSSLEPS